MHTTALFFRLVVCLSLVSSAFSTTTLAAEPEQTTETLTDTQKARQSGQPFGIEKRVPWTTSTITGSLEPPAPYKLEQLWPHFEISQPVELVSAPGSDRMFLLEVQGRIVSFKYKDPQAQLEPFADLKQEEPELYRAYGMTFHPNFAENRYCYVCYVLTAGTVDGTRVSRFEVTRDDPPKLVPGSEKIIITWDAGGHNGGCLHFGPDGYLYISTGDGGSAFPPDGRNTGQDVSDLFASILRIDVDHSENGRPYTIPKDNPFVSLENARGEIWAYGLRNPWKMAFDPDNGRLWVGDVGWELWEMVYLIQPGGNYGWSLVENTQPVHRERQRGPTPILPPTVAHSHTESRSITGGYVYRGQRLKDLQGAFVYGDHVTGKMWGTKYDGEKVTSVQELCDTPLQIVAFGVDREQELYVVGWDGSLHRLVPNPQREANKNFPRTLSATGLFESVPDHKLAPGVIPYSINAEPWADGGKAERFVALPGDTRLDVHTKQDVQVGTIKGDWKFPSDAVLVKTLSLQTDATQPDSWKRLETQVLHYDQDTWRAYNYIWNDEQTDATLAESEGFDRLIDIQDPEAPGGKRQQRWHFASRSECILCHTTRAGSIHGFKPDQVNREQNYGSVTDNQLRTLDHIGLFEQPLPDTWPRMINPHDESATLEQRARSYLHVNCAHCHRRGGGGSSAMELPIEIPLKKTNMISARPTQGTFEIHGAQVVAPGDPFRSVMYYRMSKLGRGRMPHFGSNVVDEQGIALIRDWISSIPAEEASPSDIALAKRQRAEVKKVVSSQPGSDQKLAPPADNALEELLRSTRGALMLAAELGTAEVPAKTKELIVARATTGTDAQVRDLFERFLPEDQRVQRLGTSVKPEEILALTGNADRGKELFFVSQGMACRNCHKIGKEGKEVGPELTTIGKKLDRAKLLESILEPSKVIDPKFVSYLVETSQGLVHQGLLVKQSDEVVVLRDPQNKLIEIATGDIEFMSAQQKSLMPELLFRDLTAEELADLLAFLSTLK